VTVSLATRRCTKTLNDVTYLHPCKGVPRKPLKIITPEQFDAIFAAIPGAILQLMVETDIETGMRWGELTGLRVKDLDPATRVLTISRTVVQVDPKFHPTGGRFLVKEYPKDKEYRRLKLSTQLAGKLSTHIQSGSLGPGDLLFPMPQQDSPAARLRAVPDLASLGFTTPNAAGRQYRHGTMSGYNAGRCRCQHRKDAAAIYRAQRRSEGKDAPRRPRDGGHRRSHFPRLVPAEHLAPRAQAGRADVPCARSRPAARARLLAPRGRRRPADGQGPPRPRQHRHNRKVPAHPARRRRDRSRSIRPDPQPQCDNHQARPWEVGMNCRSRRLALYAIGTIAILASANALAHSYAGLYDWAVHHRLGGWQAKSWPAEIDLFLAIGELALYIAYLDDWPTRQRIWPWATALIGLAVSVAGNIGHVQAEPGQPVILADRLTAATSPLAAFAGLSVGLLVVKMTRQRASSHAQQPGTNAALVLAPDPANSGQAAAPTVPTPVVIRTTVPDDRPEDGERDGTKPDTGLLRDATAICQHAAARGERLSQRALARQLRLRGHRFPNDHLQQIAQSVGLAPGRAA
jgi:hypothetical protein